jgi:cytochrome c-type biogenesis protein CcmH/NrfG
MTESDFPGPEPRSEALDAAGSGPEQELALLRDRVEQLEASQRDVNAKLGAFEQTRRRANQRALLFRVLLLVLLLAAYFVMQQRYSAVGL